jgi:hypothetical protein
MGWGIKQLIFMQILFFLGMVTAGGPYRATLFNIAGREHKRNQACSKWYLSGIDHFSLLK